MVSQAEPLQPLTSDSLLLVLWECLSSVTSLGCHVGDIVQGMWLVSSVGSVAV